MMVARLVRMAVAPADGTIDCGWGSEAECGWGVCDCRQKNVTAGSANAASIATMRRQRQLATAAFRASRWRTISTSATAAPCHSECSRVKPRRWVYEDSSRD